MADIKQIQVGTLTYDIKDDTAAHSIEDLGIEIGDLKTINNQTLIGTGNIDAETTDNKVTSLSATSTDVEYPSAKVVYDNLELKENADTTILKQANVVDNVTSTSSVYPLSANQGKILQTEINNLKNIGRFLAILDASAGTVSSQPSGSVGDTYDYKVGDYYRVGVAGNYSPKTTATYTIDTTSGSSNFESGGTSYAIGDVIYCSNLTPSTSTWVKQGSSGGGTVQDVQINSASILSGGIANIIVDNTPTESSTNLVESGGVKTQLDLKADTSDIPTTTSDLTNDQMMFGGSITENNVTVVRDTTQGVAPYNPSYKYTNITINNRSEDELQEGSCWVYVTTGDLIVASSYRNVRIRFGENGTWYPVFYGGSIVAGNSYFVENAVRVLTFNRNILSTGAFSILTDTDTNTTYSPPKLGFGLATCDTEEATTAKTAALSNYALNTGGIVCVKFTYSVPASSTLNINSKGAKAIYYNGSAITSGVINAGDTITFIYNGTNYVAINKDTLNNIPTAVSQLTNDTGYITSSGSITGSSGSCTGNAATATSATSATTASKLGSSTVGGTAKPIYLSSGTATACSSTVGGSTTPVYMNAGTITACTAYSSATVGTANKLGSSTVGGAAKPIYLSSGTATACSSTVGSASKPVYMSSGTITACSSTVGGSTTPVYMNSGTITACTAYGSSVAGSAKALYVNSTTIAISVVSSW